MIAVESFRKFRIVDILALLIIALIWLGLNYILEASLGPQEVYIISLFIFTFFLSFAVHLVRKAGSATIFCAICGIISYNLSDLGIVGINKFYSLLVVGILFEIVYLILKLEIKNVQLDIILGTGFSAASIPVMTALLLSPTIAIDMLTSFLNIILLSFFVGLMGSFVSFLVWYKMKVFKWILRFEYGG